MSQSELPESLARAMIAAAADGFVVTDGHGTIVFANAAAAAMFGWSHDELVGQPIEMLVPEPLRGAHEAHRRCFIDAPRTRSMGEGRALTGRKRDGSELPIEVGLSPVETPEGRFVFASIRDVTERRRGLEALARSETRLRELITHAPDGIFVTDPEGRYTDVNVAACELLGYSRDELIGKTIVDLLPPEDLPRVMATRARLRASSDVIEIGEWMLLRKDGVAVPVEVSAKVLANGQGQAFVRDIRERKRAEHELRVAESERAAALRDLEVALEQCPASITFLRGPKGQRVDRNRAARATWEHRFDASRGFDQCTDYVCKPDGAPLAVEELPAVRALRGERIEHERLAVRTADGAALVPYEINAAPTFDERGELSGAVVVAWDVSAVVELERLRAEWNAVVAHDLRQPINSLMLYTQVLELHAGSSPERLHRDIAGITQLVARLSRMVDDLLDLSQLDASRLTIEWRSLDIVECVRAGVERIELQDPELHVEVRVEGEIPRLEGDPQRLAQVMDNLLSNAVKYRWAGSPIRIEVARDGDRVAVAVTNDGAGIEAPDLWRLFRRFERIGGASQSGVPGIGLGLQIASGLVEAHGGEITARSVPGEATTFRFTLPLSAPPSHPGRR